MKKISLKEAIAKGKLQQFIKERQDKTGDQEQFDATLSSMTENSPEDQEASSQEQDEN